MEMVYQHEFCGVKQTEFRSRNYRQLANMAFDLKRQGADVWMNIFDSCEGIYILTVYQKKAA